MIRKLAAEDRSRLRSSIAITSFAQCAEELVLNAIDADATCVAVRVDLGLGRIQVVDNGCGISRDDLYRVTERYCTSKCDSLTDLEDNLQHYGYRGEALASIRHICGSLEIESRHKSSSTTHVKLCKSGVQCGVVEGNSHRPSHGTTITVHDLFHKLPVRKKGLNAALEFERIRQRIEAIALIQPQKSFSLKNEETGQKVLQTHKTNSVLGAFTYLFGTSKARYLCQVQGSNDVYHVNGYVSKEAHSNKSLQFVYINDRLVLNTKIHRLLKWLFSRSSLLNRNRVKKTSEFQGKVSPGNSPQKQVKRYAVFILTVSSPFSDYDITFDPTKTLVEFKHWTPVLNCVEKAMNEFLWKEGLKNKNETDEKPDDILSQVNVHEDISKDDLDLDGEISKKNKLKPYGSLIDTYSRKHSLHSAVVRRPVTCTVTRSSESPTDDSDILFSEQNKSAEEDAREESDKSPIFTKGPQDTQSLSQDLTLAQRLSPDNVNSLSQDTLQDFTTTCAGDGNTPSSGFGKKKIEDRKLGLNYDKQGLIIDDKIGLNYAIPKSPLRFAYESSDSDNDMTTSLDESTRKLISPNSEVETQTMSPEQNERQTSPDLTLERQTLSPSLTLGQRLNPNTQDSESQESGIITLSGSQNRSSIEQFRASFKPIKHSNSDFVPSPVSSLQSMKSRIRNITQGQDETFTSSLGQFKKHADVTKHKRTLSNSQESGSQDNDVMAELMEIRRQIVGTRSAGPTCTKREKFGTMSAGATCTKREKFFGNRETTNETKESNQQGDGISSSQEYSRKPAESVDQKPFALNSPPVSISNASLSENRALVTNAVFQVPLTTNATSLNTATRYNGNKSDTSDSVGRELITQESIPAYQTPRTFLAANLTSSSTTKANTFVQNSRKRTSPVMSTLASKLSRKVNKNENCGDYENSSKLPTENNMNKPASDSSSVGSMFDAQSRLGIESKTDNTNGQNKFEYSVSQRKSINQDASNAFDFAVPPNDNRFRSSEARNLSLSEKLQRYSNKRVNISEPVSSDKTTVTSMVSYQTPKTFLASCFSTGDENTQKSLPPYKTHKTFLATVNADNSPINKFSKAVSAARSFLTNECLASAVEDEGNENFNFRPVNNFNNPYLPSHRNIPADEFDQLERTYKPHSTVDMFNDEPEKLKFVHKNLFTNTVEVVNKPKDKICAKQMKSDIAIQTDLCLSDLKNIDDSAISSHVNRTYNQTNNTDPLVNDSSRVNRKCNGTNEVDPCMSDSPNEKSSQCCIENCTSTCNQRNSVVKRTRYDHHKSSSSHMIVKQADFELEFVPLSKEVDPENLPLNHFKRPMSLENVGKFGETDRKSCETVLPHETTKVREIVLPSGENQKPHETVHNSCETIRESSETVLPDECEMFHASKDMSSFLDDDILTDANTSYTDYQSERKTIVINTPSLSLFSALCKRSTRKVRTGDEKQKEDTLLPGHEMHKDDNIRTGVEIHNIIEMCKYNELHHGNEMHGDSKTRAGNEMRKTNERRTEGESISVSESQGFDPCLGSQGFIPSDSGICNSISSQIESQGFNTGVSNQNLKHYVTEGSDMCSTSNLSNVTEGSDVCSINNRTKLSDYTWTPIAKRNNSKSDNENLISVKNRSADNVSDNLTLHTTQGANKSALKAGNDEKALGYIQNGSSEVGQKSTHKINGDVSQTKEISVIDTETGCLSDKTVCDTHTNGQQRKDGGYLSTGQVTSSADASYQSTEKTRIGVNRWICKIDPRTGRTLYIDSVTGNTSYTQPYDNNNVSQQPKTDILTNTRLLSHNATPFINNGPKFKPQSTGPVDPGLRTAFTDHKEAQEKEEQVKWREYSKDTKRPSVSELFENWDNPMYKVPQPEALRLEISGESRSFNMIHQMVNPVTFTKDMFESIKVLGQVDNKFLACLMKTDKRRDVYNMLIVIDQHAAHERVRLEQLTGDVYETDADGERSVRCNKLKKSTDISLNPEEVRLAMVYRENLLKQGVGITQRDRDTVTVHTVPTCLVEKETGEKNRKFTQADLLAVVQGMVKEQIEVLEATRGGDRTLAKAVHRELASQSCHGAIKFGDPLDADECVQLIEELSRCKLPFQCAHGRPSIMPILDLTHLEKVAYQRPRKPQLWKLSRKSNEVDQTLSYLAKRDISTEGDINVFKRL